MKKIYILIVLFCIHAAKAQKHKITLGSLIECSMMPPQAFTHFMKQKGFKTIPDSTFSLNTCFQRSSKDKTIKQVLWRRENADTVFVTLQTTAETEFLNWKKELQENDFINYREAGSTAQSITGFQKRNLIAKLSEVKNNGAPVYSITLQKKTLPFASDIHYAEDLLQLNTHEYIAAVFGAANVKKDLFYFTEKEANKCSILFPNTSNQVIFIWEDEENNQDISFLILGGQAHETSDAGIFHGNQFHKWRSKQGIYLGMPLRELQLLNGQPIEFYGWDTDQPGFVVNKNSGRINFKHLGIQLQCLDCYQDHKGYFNQLLTSENVLKSNDRVLVNSLIIMPDKPVATIR